MGVPLRLIDLDSGLVVKNLFDLVEGIRRSGWSRPRVFRLAASQTTGRLSIQIVHPNRMDTSPTSRTLLSHPFLARATVGQNLPQRVSRKPWPM
jgi:hypothetical protein